MVFTSQENDHCTV